MVDAQKHSVLCRRIERNQGDFPLRLRALERIEFVEQVGKVDWSKPVVSIVGSRAATRRGMAIAKELASQLAKAGVVILSGGAVGIDRAAHEGALEVGGQTVAVLGSGIDVVYPSRNKGMFRTIVKRDGALLSPFPRGARPLPGRFASRNAVMAGLSDCVVVVEAGLDSGTLHTTKAALKLSRKVCAFSGSPGCEQLLSEGVFHVKDAGDVLEVLEGSGQVVKVELPQGDTELYRVFEQLEDRPIATGVIAKQCGLAVLQTARLLAQLEMDGLAIVRSGRRYALSPVARNKVINHD